MIPSPPPRPLMVLLGFTLAVRMAVRKDDPSVVTPTPKKVWDALWIRFFLLMASGMAMLGMDNANLIPLLLATVMVDTLSYPVISQFTLKQIGLAERFPLFIMCMTWIGNLRIILMLTGLFATGAGENLVGAFILAVLAVWMLWATWWVAARSLGNRGWLGGGMLVLMMFTEFLNAMVMLTFIQPQMAGPGQ